LLAIITGAAFKIRFLPPRKHIAYSLRKSLP